MRAYVVSEPACRNDHEHGEACSYQVAWSINPHMRVGQAHALRAHAQHAAFVRALRTVGARVLQLPFVHGAYDSVFMKDSVVLASKQGQRRALPATLVHPQRSCEPGQRAAVLARAGFECGAPLATPLEGGDVCVLPHRRLALMGHGVRSSRDSASGLSAFLGLPVTTLELRDPLWFHLDTALAVLPDDTAVVCEAAFTPAALRTIRSLGFSRVVAVDTAEAERFSINVVAVDGAIVTGTRSDAMTALWAELGYQPVVAPLDEFQLAGGSAACLVAEVHALDEAAARIAA